MHWLSSPLDRLRDGAREYADRGWRVAPAHYLSIPGRHRRNAKRRPLGDTCSCRDLRCPRPGAHPLSPRWAIDGTTDAGTIEYWWGGPQPWNITLPTGELFDVWRAPVDVAGRALESLRASAAEVGPVAHTPSGEWLFFTAARLGDEPLEVPAGLPVTYHGPDDYVLAPPSQQAGSGMRWWRAPDPADHRLPRWEPIAEALLRLARQRRAGPTVVPMPRAG